MDKLVEMGILFDYYGKLLTGTQYDVVDQYYNQDLSLTEIAKLNSISKQAVSENLKRAEKNLYDYENTLALIEKNRATIDLIEEHNIAIENIISGMEDGDNKKSLINLKNRTDVFLKKI